MERAGDLVDESIEAGRQSPATVAAQLLAALKKFPDVQVAPAGAGSYRLVRRVLPSSARTAAWITGPLLIGLLFLLVRREESCLITISEVDGASTVTLSGRLSAPAREAIRLALGAAKSATPSYATGSATVYRDGGTRRREPMPRERDTPQLAPQCRLRFTSGLVETIDGLILVGRDPAAGPGETARRLIPVEDPGRSVSKTHFAVNVDSTGLWLMDRHSTNGTAVIDGAGQRVNCPAGQRIPVKPPCRVVFGDLEVAVLAM